MVEHFRDVQVKKCLLKFFFRQVNWERKRKRRRGDIVSLRVKLARQHGYFRSKAIYSNQYLIGLYFTFYDEKKIFT